MPVHSSTSTKLEMSLLTFFHEEMRFASQLLFAAVLQHHLFNLALQLTITEIG
jgi:hypothetical protein